MLLGRSKWNVKAAIDDRDADDPWLFDACVVVVDGKGSRDRLLELRQARAREVLIRSDGAERHITAERRSVS
jgi:hypothetical protein